MGKASSSSVFFDSPSLLRCDHQLNAQHRAGCASTGHGEYRPSPSNIPYYKYVKAAVTSGLPSRCPIPSQHNLDGGRELLGMHTTQRIFEGDRFHVLL